MGLLVWATIGIAIWHFTVFVPDRFRGGIVGALLGAAIGALFSGWALHGFQHIPGRHDTHLLTAVEAVPGALLGLILVYIWGVAQERRNPSRI